MNLIESIVIAIVEGLTEYLPISSTGHMIITSSLMGIHKDEFTKIYEVAIQLGAIMAVVVLYWRKFFDFSKWQFYARLVVAVIPALLLGKLLSDTIDRLLESPLTVAITLFCGGIILLFIDRYFLNNTLDDEKKVSYKQAFITGLWQCLALIPGVSRSAASIIGGMQQGMSRRLAAEFSFFLAVPTMFAATIYKLYFNTQAFSSEQVKLLVLGNIIAFVVAVIAIRFFIGFLQKYGFRFFGWYRIIAGIILFILIASGVIQQ
ncbi:MAG TPA: undecaprenyl-diphosphate phosphatase [Flavitalea sp.]|nr:undecaprenyl-diphosphate phosphatase [Flavitalea sp.]